MKIPIIGKPLEYTLKLVGLWPDQFYIFGPIVTISALITMIPFQCWDTIRVSDNPFMVMDNLSQLMSEFLLYIKLIVIWFNKSYVDDLLREMADDYEKQLVSEKWLLLDYNSRRFCKYDYIMYFSASVLFYIQFILMYTEMPVESREMMLKAHYPFDYKKSPIFEIMTVIQIIQGLLMCSIQALCESFLVAVVLHVCGHIDLLIDQIKMYSENCKFNENSCSLLLVIKSHWKVLNLVNKIETIYTYISFAQVFLSTFIICATGFVLLTMTKSDEIVILIKYVMLYIVLMWQTFSFCFAGQHLINKSELIYSRMCNVCWYNNGPKEIKAISFIINKAQTPLSLSAGKFIALSTQSFSLIIKTSFSYLSVLRASYT